MIGLRGLDDTWLASLQRFPVFLSSLSGAALRLLAGWLIASALAKFSAKAWRAIGCEHAVPGSGIGHFVERSGACGTTSRVIGLLPKWFVFLLFAQAAAYVLHRPQWTQMTNPFIPTMMMAGAIAVAGWLSASGSSQVGMRMDQGMASR